MKKLTRKPVVSLSLLGLWLCGVSSPAAAQSVPQPEVVVWRHLTTGMAASVTEGWQKTRTDASIAGGPLRVAGRRYEKGLGTHAPGEIVYRLEKKHRLFKARVGVDDAGGPAGSVVFKVLLDGAEVFDSGLLRTGQEPKDIEI